ncbi:MAG: malto-oligosyltrehalose synthase [Burkholderiales bacterium]|nr:malto-oligosyltrehalose synthase [Burkholderiales bacterium]
MAERAALERLGRIHQIAPDYYDVWGNRHEVSGASLAALLAALGVRAGTPQEVEDSIRSTESARWRAVLPPALVLRVEAAPWTIRLNLPAAEAKSALIWRLTEENGARREGALHPASIEVAESAEVNGERYLARDFTLPVATPCGYHRLGILRDGAMLGETSFIVVPARSFRPCAVENDGRIWGAAAQLYAVRSERNWGVGDFTDLATLLAQWGARGAGIVGVNPLHALFPHNPEHASPYSPSSRCFVNVLYLDVEAVPDFSECEEAHTYARAPAFQSRLKALRDADLVDYAGVAEVKLPLLERCYAHFRNRHLAFNTPRAQAFRAYQAAYSPALRRHALFEALQEQFHREDPQVWGWPVWPQAYRDPAAPEVARFAESRAERVEFYEYLQWQAELQLEAVGRRSMDIGLGVGLYQDLAVSVDRGGAEAWANQNLYAIAASVGAPPDDFNLRGQDWGLPPLAPERLRAAAYAPFIATLRANMRHSGALRIDHVMALARLYWVPQGGEPREGAYVYYPFEDLVGIVALESHRNRCMVIGEDLGTVPDDVRATLARVGILSYRVLFFERQQSGEFKAPAEYPADALVTAATHDLPTLAAYWEGRDLALRHELGLFPTTEAHQGQVLGRAQDRARLLLALEREGLLPEGVSVDPQSLPEMSAALLRQLHAFLARCPARVLVVQLEDVLGAREQVNLPGTTGEYPNWRRKLSLALERWPEDERYTGLARVVSALRPQAQPKRAQGASAEAKVPRATYRLQLNRDFTFADAARLVPYLDALGVSHVYCSPYLRARPDSTHGYDITDHNAFNPDLGGAQGFERLCEELRIRGMGQILDMVPNHMGVMGADNEWWMDVLENGPASAFGEYFDIDWQPVNPELVNRVLVPVLGDHYGVVLEAAEFRLAFEAERGSFSVFYHEHRFPVDPRDYPRILERALHSLEGTRVAQEAMLEAASLAAAFAHLPSRSETAPEKTAERNRDKELHKRRLAQLVRAHPALAEAIEHAVRALNGTPGQRASFDALDALLEAQAYRLAFWRVASDEINYRRFFDINDLAALRMENEAVFKATHDFVLGLAAQGKVDGLRIDHCDGLYDPAQYFLRLQEHYARIAGLDSPQVDADGRPARPLYVVVEKIAASHEHVPTAWAVHGTTGYRFTTVVNALFVDRLARAKLDRVWRAFSGESVDFDEAAYRGKRDMTRSALASELTVLATELLRIARADRRTRDYTFNTLRRAIAEAASCFPVYRTYVAEGLTAQDRRYIDWAVARARKRVRAADATVFDFLRLALLASAPEEATPELKERYRAFAMKFQQFTSPVAAKGVEDTSFYNFNRLVSLNEVGGDPDMFGMTVSAFHGASADRAARWPHTMLATSTHDNKRAEDVRCRIDVLSEMPAAWRLALRRWSRMNASQRRTVDGAGAPSRNDEYLLYQTLLGTFPDEPMDAAALDVYRERIKSYMLKAAREAKRHTSWVNANAEYEEALAGFVRALLGRPEANLFLDDLRLQAAPITWFGVLNSLSMALVKLTSPGAPDFYQGCELIDLSLVDPDNRRPVDYARRRALLEELQGVAAAPAQELAAGVRRFFDHPSDGRAKFWLIWRTLQFRREHAELFRKGDYHPVAVCGGRSRNALAYARRLGGRGIVAVVARLFASMGLEQGRLPVGQAAWGDTVLDLAFLPGGTRLTNVLTGESLEMDASGRLPLSRAMADFPGALLAYEAPAAAPHSDQKGEIDGTAAQ